jgi:hypothetical protein
MSRGRGRAGGARTRAVSVLREVLERGARAAPLVAVRAEGLAEADRGLLRELVFGVLRWKDALDHEIAGTSLPRLRSQPAGDPRGGPHPLRHWTGSRPCAAVSEAVATEVERAARARQLVNGVPRYPSAASTETPLPRG